MDEESEEWNRNDDSFRSFAKAPMPSNIEQLPQLTYSKRKLSGPEKPRKILRTGQSTAYKRRKVEVNHEEDQVEQSFTDALDLIAAENANSSTVTTSCAVPLYYVADSGESDPTFNYLDKKANESVSVTTKPVLCEPDLEVPVSVTNNQPKLEQIASKNEKLEIEVPPPSSVRPPDQSPITEEPCLGPKAFGLVPVQNPPQTSNPTSPTSKRDHNGQSKLEDKITALEQQFTLLQNKHDILQESHDKLAQLVEAQNHLLACHTAPPPTREALSSFPADESEFIQSPTEVISPISQAPDLPRGKRSQGPVQQFKLPRKVTAKDIIRLWEEGTRYLPPVKNWSPAQKMKVQSKLSRWKKIIDIFKGECNGDMENFEQKYSGEVGELLPVTTILALHENQLSSEFLSRGFSNTKLNTIELKSPLEFKKEPEDEAPELNNEDSTTADEDILVKGAKFESGETNRYVLPRKVTARDVVQLWDSGCEDFPAIGTWTKAQKIGQETKIFRWRKIVDIFKKDCNSDWDMFTERYSNEKGELLPLATILAKHEAIYAQDQMITNKQTPNKSEDSDAEKSTPSEAVKNEKSPRDPNCVTLPRKVTAYEVVRYWTEGSETFGPVKDWTRTQKMGQETKISRWKKIYEIFRYQCYRDWDEFCQRYTNQRGELLPIATILAKYEAENPSGVPSYQLHGKESPGRVTPGAASHDSATDGDDNPADGTWALTERTNIMISVNDNGEYILPSKLSPVEALSLWEHGTEQIPPIKNWTDEQVEQAEQTSLLTTIRHLAQIFEQECGGHFRRFVERFSDADGEILPIAGIIYSNQSRKYSPYFTEFEKSIKQSRSKGEQYELPKRVSAKEIVWLWEHGCRQFPPVKAWSSAQKLRYTTKLCRWRKIVEIFHQKCDSDWRIYEEKYSNASGELLAISTVISMQDDSDNDSYASMIKKSINSPETNGKVWSRSSTSTESQANTSKNSEGDLSIHEGETLRNDLSKDDSSKEFHLPRKVNALDIINFWECGFGDMPPVAQWSPLQKFRQRSKISRWSKVYDIYKNHCKANIVEFEKLYSDKNGQLLPATTIISMYESRVDGDSFNGSFEEEAAAPTGPVVRRYVLPRKVDAKDIVRLWDKGNNDFPAIGSWTKADKIGQETKIFRWKKIVDIFKNHCGSDWTLFEELFANEYGELLPTSAIIAKYETTCTKN